MKVIFTCGGTARHVNPALALAGLLKERRPDSEVLFVGAHRGIERELIETAGWPFRAVEVSNFHRSLRPKEIWHNLVSLRNFLRSPGEARALLGEFPADLVVGTGGYASYPMIQAYPPPSTSPTPSRASPPACWRAARISLWWGSRSAGKTTSTRIRCW